MELAAVSKVESITRHFFCTERGKNVNIVFDSVLQIFFSNKDDFG
jgi:hypothetical protein